MAKIMIVDDSTDVQILMNDFLVAHQHEIVAFANNGIEAIEKYNSIKPEIVLLDLELPQLDGLSVLKEIKSKDPNVKIIIITGNDSISIFRECSNLGALAFILKPYNLNEVLDTITYVSEISPLENLS